ncbi:hypothetical protein [Crucivirus-506]|nr:hypothetical protein [Crucivirus-505]QMW68993.1 hypothetical protein [Crucivirus-506]
MPLAAQDSLATPSTTKLQSSALAPALLTLPTNVLRDFVLRMMKIFPTHKYSISAAKKSYQKMIPKPRRKTQIQKSTNSCHNISKKKPNSGYKTTAKLTSPWHLICT